MRQPGRGRRCMRILVSRRLLDEREVANCDLTWWHGGWKYPFLAFTKHANPSVSPRFDFTIEFIRVIYPKNFISHDGAGH